MAKQVLPVNFKDDLLAESMNGKRKYRMIDNDDGTISLEDVSEYLQTGSTFGAGQINSTNQAVNDSVDKDKVLKTLEEVSASTDSDAVVGRGAVAELNQNMGNCKFSSDANGAYVTYTANGSTVKKKLGEVQRTYLGSVGTSATTVDCTKIDGYKDLTVNNFALIPKSINGQFVPPANGATSLSNMRVNTTETIGEMSYNANTGVLTVPKLSLNYVYSYASMWAIKLDANVTYDLYCFHN